MQLMISPRLKHKIDKYVKYVNAVLFTKTSIVLQSILYVKVKELFDESNFVFTRERLFIYLLFNLHADVNFWIHGSNFLRFHAVFGKIWPNNRLASPPPFGLARPLWDATDASLVVLF